MKRWALLFALALLGCPRASVSRKEVPPEPPDPVAQARSVLEACYAAVRSGSADRLAPLLTPSALVFGLGPSEVFEAKEPFLAKARQELTAAAPDAGVLSISGASIRVGLSDNRRAAWLFDSPVVQVESGGERRTWIPRVTALAIQGDAGWQLDALHVSLPVPDATLVSPGIPTIYTPPLGVTPDRSTDSEALVTATKGLLEQLSVKLERTSERPEVYLVGSAVADLFSGSSFRELRPRLPELKRSYLAPSIDGPLRARLTPDGQSGWVAGVVTVRQVLKKKTVSLPPMRALWLFTSEQGSYRMVSEHLSVSLRPDQRRPATSAELELRDQVLPRALAKKKAYDDDPGLRYW